MRPQLTAIHDAVVSVSPNSFGALTTIYIKYTAPETGPLPFAVLWVKKSTELILGLALPNSYETGSQHVATTNLKYAGLTVYLKFTASDEIPAQLREWIGAAYRNLLPK
jgi:hypothetical protein